MTREQTGQTPAPPRRVPTVADSIRCPGCSRPVDVTAPTDVRFRIIQAENPTAPVMSRSTSAGHASTAAWSASTGTWR